uniref:F-box domain-containing protein n=1 Tax=Kalanchoe fedtschenkoi TaxID=63787 RepID=A0A7N0UD58_KALFE
MSEWKDKGDSQQEAMCGPKRKIRSDISVDRISHLPDNVIDCIINRLNICDALKTSALSKRWRHCWKWAGRFEFDMDFYWGIIYRKGLELKNVVGSVLSQQLVSADKFLLFASNPFAPKESVDVSQWLALLSEKGVKDFTLLAYLSNNLGSFGNLVYLDLDDVIISDEALQLLISNFPILETLTLTFRASGSPFVVSGRKLKTLAFYSAMVPKPLALSDMPSLTTAYFMSDLVIPMYFHDEPKLYRFIYLLPKLERLVIDVVALKSLAVGHIPKQVSRTANCLKHLELWLIDVSSLDQLKCAFCLIRSSPNLQSLTVQINKPPNPMERPTTAEFLEGEIQGSRLSGLKTVRFLRYAGFPCELFKSLAQLLPHGGVCLLRNCKKWDLSVSRLGCWSDDRSPSLILAPSAKIPVLLPLQQDPSSICSLMF